MRKEEKSSGREALLGLLLPVMTLGLTAGILLGRSGSEWWPGAIALCGALPLFLLLRGKGRLLAGGMAALCLGFLLGYLAYHPALPEPGEYRVSGIVSSEVLTRENGQVRARLTDVTLNGQPGPSLYWSFYLPAGEQEPPADLTPGCRAEMTASLYHPSGADNPGGFDFREYLLTQRLTAGLYGCGDPRWSQPEGFHLMGFMASLREKLSRGLRFALGEETGAYASAMLLGLRSMIPEEDQNAFSKLGIAHVLTVSGFHVGLLAAALLLLTSRLDRRWQISLVGAALLFYCLLTGGHPPVIRAAILTMTTLLGRLRHRQINSLWLLMTAWCLTLLISPAELTGAGFLMTYGAVGGLVILGRPLQGLWHPRGRLLNWLWQGLCASAAAQIGLMLLLLWFYQEIPLIGILLNIGVLAFFTLLIGTYYGVLVLLPFPAAAGLLGQGSRILTEGMTTALHWLEKLPAFVLWTHRPNGWTVLGWALLMTGCLTLLRLKKRPRAVLCTTGILLVVLSLIPWPHHGVTYIQFSVGNGDAALLWDQDHVTVIDTGEDGQALASFLHQNRLTVDELLLTHLHTDHAGGLQSLLERGIPVKRICLPAGAEEAAVQPEVIAILREWQEAGGEVIHLSRGDRLELPEGSLEVCWPEAGKTRPGGDANETSLTLLADILGTRLLLTGDLDGKYENYAAQPAHILKAAHHGSSASTGEVFLEQVAPQDILLSGGDAKRLESMKVRAGDTPVWGTWEKGAVILNFGEGNYSIQTMK